jgi:hypothetical protein
MFEAYSHSNHEGLIAASCIEKEVRFGSKAAVSPLERHVRCTLRSRHSSARPAWPKSAMMYGPAALYKRDFRERRT